VFVRGGSELVLNGQTKLGDIRQLKAKSEFTVSGGLSGIIEKITVAPGSGPMTFTGAIRNLNVTAANNTFTLKMAAVMNAVFDAYNSKLDADQYSYISTLEAKQPVVVTGRGKIGNVMVDGGGSGSSFEVHPNKVTVPAASKVFLASNEYSNDSGGSKVYTLPADPQPPEMGNASLLATNIKEDRMTIAWKAASDNSTVRSKLRYMLFYSPDKFGMDTPEGLEMNAIPANAYYAENLLSLTVGRLKSDTKYYFNVVVMDETGNKSCYTPLNMGLEGDNNAPTIWSSTIEIEKLSDKEYVFRWQKARDTDDMTPHEYLRYTLYETDRSDLYTVYDWIESAKAVMPATEDVSEYKLTNPTQNKQLYYTVIVQDTAGNAARYEILSFGIDAKAPVTPKENALSIDWAEGANSAALTWTAANDTDGGTYGTPAHMLTYYVYYMESKLSSIEEIRKTNPVGSGFTGVPSSPVPIPAPPGGSTYYYAVIVQDGAGNMTLYPTAELKNPEVPAPSPEPSE
jgi:hypothetical protein